MPARPGSPYAVRLTATWIAASGSGVLTGQSLPATSRAPARCRSPNGYCQRDRSSPRNGSVSSTIWSSRQAHSACRLAATPSSANRGTSSGWTTCRWAMWCRAPGRPAGRALAAVERVQRLARAAVADRVHVHLEARSAERGDALPQRGGVDERVAGVVGRVAAAVEVRRRSARP